MFQLFTFKGSPKKPGTNGFSPLGHNMFNYLTKHSSSSCWLGLKCLVNKLFGIDNWDRLML